jgi:hypothetical protein
MRPRALPGAGLAILAFLAFLLPGMARAQQSVSASILGTVTDQSGAVVPSAQITVKNIGTGITNTAKSDDKGEYLVQFLQIGNYEVTVDAKGFKKFVAKNIALTAGDHARVDAKMTLGAANETVTVSAIAAPALQTDTSTVSSEIPSTNIQDVPLSGRNLTDLVLMTAGVQTTIFDSKLDNGCQATKANGNMMSPDDCRMGSGYVVNGESDLNQNNQLDGMDNNDRHIGDVEVKPSIDAIEEVKVQTSLYSADTGRTSGGVVQIVTKSGSNLFKGSMYEYLRNDAFDAWTTWATTKPALRQNQFGATFGGPILKNKTFFFADYEGLRISQTTPPQGSGTQVPDQPVLTAIASGSITDINTALAADGLGQLPAGATIDPVAKNIMALFPSGSHNTCTALGSASTCYYKGNTPRTQNANTADIRIDQHINDRNTLYGRYSYNLTNTFNGGTFPSMTINGGVFNVGGTSAVQPEDNLSLDYTHIFKPNLILDLKAGYTYSKNFAAPNDPLNDQTLLGFDCGGVTCPPNTSSTLARAGLPSISCIGPVSTGGGGGGPPGGGGTPCNDSGAWNGIGESGWVPDLIRNHVHQYNASLTWTKGTQNIKFGVSLIDRQLIGGQEGSAFGSISFMSGSVCPDINGGNAIATSTVAFLMGCAAAKSRNFQAVNPHFRTYEPSAYIQDDWRVLPKLTLNLGVRYDLYTPYSDEDGFISNFDPAAVDTYNGITYTGVLVSPDLLGAQHSDKYGNVPLDMHDVQPRFGFAWSLPQNMVLRGGFGMSYYPGTFGPQSMPVNPPFTYSLSCAISYAGSTTTVYGTANSMCTGVDDTLDGGFPIPNTGSSSVVLTATDPAMYSSLGNFNNTDTHLKTSAMYQYSLQGQKDWRGNIITVGYVGNLGRHLAQMQNENETSDSGAYFAWNGANTAGPNYMNPLTNKSEPFGYPFADLNNYTCTTPGQCTGTSPNISGISSAGLGVINSVAVSDYNGLQASFLRRSSAGLTTSINYTWAHTMTNGLLLNENNGNDPTCTNYGCRLDNGTGSAATAKIVGEGQIQWGNSALDLRHRVAGVVTYQLPFARNTHGIVHGVAAGWTGNLMGTLQTGMHYSVTTSGKGGGGPGGPPGGGGPGGPPSGGTSCMTPAQLAVAPPGTSNPSWCPTTWSGVSSDEAPNLVAGCDTKKRPAGMSELDEYFNLDCYKLQQFGTYGNSRLGQLAGPGMFRADISMIKEFDLHENFKLQFRMEGFNITNHPNYSEPNSSVGCSNYDTSGAPNCTAQVLYSDAGTLSGGIPLQPAVASCEASRTGTSSGGGPPGGGPIACITSTQGVNRQFQFALKLSF